MSFMLKRILKHIYSILLWLGIGAYIVYFSYFTILRYRTLYSSYYDLGIMNQTVFNTYKAMVEKNPSKILEETDPISGMQIKRMAIHNDLLLAVISPLYVIHAGPETLLILQSVILGLGALAMFKIVLHLLKNERYKDIVALVFAYAYLLYAPMERANIFDFHAVTLATTFLLWMVYLWLVKRYYWSIVFFLLSLLSKEQVGLTTLFFGGFVLWNHHFAKEEGKKEKIYGLMVVIVSFVWVILSFLVIIPYFRGGDHFAVVRYGDFGDSPIRILIGIIKNPYSVQKYLFQIDTLRYFFFLLGPLAFLSLVSPLQLLIALPEFAINLLSNNGNMRNIIFHYTAVIQPFVFLSAAYGFRKALSSKRKILVFLLPVLVVCSFLFAYYKGPLPYAREQEIHPFKYPQHSSKEIEIWAKTLRDTSLKIAATGQVAPLFSSRRYLYLFPHGYKEADYVVITLNEIYNYPEKDINIPALDQLKNDSTFERIYQSKNVEVYKKIKEKNSVKTPTY